MSGHILAPLKKPHFTARQLEDGRRQQNMRLIEAGLAASRAYTAGSTRKFIHADDRVLIGNKGWYILGGCLACGSIALSLFRWSDGGGPYKDDTLYVISGVLGGVSFLSFSIGCLYNRSCEWLKPTKASSPFKQQSLGSLFRSTSSERSGAIAYH